MISYKQQNSFLNKLKLKHPHIFLLETYRGSHIPVRFKCGKCRDIFSKKPYLVLNSKNGCGKCSGKHRRTEKEYICDLKKINPDIICIENYINNKTPIKHKCLLCSFIWKPYPYNLLIKKSRCPNCYNIRYKSADKFIAELKEKHPDIQIISEYKNRKTKSKFKCLICDNIWYTTPDSLLNSVKGCPVCGKNSRILKRKRTHEEYIKILSAKNLISNVWKIILAITHRFCIDV